VPYNLKKYRAVKICDETIIVLAIMATHFERTGKREQM